ncbi:MAG TPA: UvrD-helicase domain-containing protein [Acidimicrobiales bacterium]|nr:UvrD-helicase domain-containing protein [Acidimicrobiales bacterium]
MPATPSDAELLEGLNPVQREAVIHDEGPLLVIAGAGSGKTRVLTSRIAHLIKNGVSPFEILAITFTNKAAQEMKHRVGALVGPVAEKMWVSTFHSACVRILRRDGHRLGYPSSFTIYDQADAVRLTGYVIRDKGLDAKRFPPRSVHGTISAAKNDDVGPEAFAERVREPFERKIADVYAEYQDRLLKAGAMDFDDILRNAVELFRREPEVLDHYRRRFQHVLVDEYQDTNKVQNELILQLAGEHHNVCIVGDSDQCLLPGTLVDTPDGQRPIEDIQVGDHVLGARGGDVAEAGTVTAVAPGRYEGRVYRVKAGDGEIVGTPHHMVPVRVVLDEGTHIVYLMGRTGQGYRIGRTKSVRPGNKGDQQLGTLVRMNQERGDCLWILGVYPTLEDSAWWESWFAAQYGLPTACFHTVGRSGMAMGQEALDRLFAAIDTETRAKDLLEDFDLHFEFPHVVPRNGRRRQTLNLTMFSDVRGSNAGHRIQWSSNRGDIADRLREAGFPARDGKRPGTFLLELYRSSFVEALETANAIAFAGGLDVRRRASVAGHIWDLQPLSHLRPGMEMLHASEDGTLSPVRVDSVSSGDYSGPVHDLEVSPTHTFVAGSLVVRNSIYRFRGADIRNILEFEEAFPDATVVVLEQNYRSTQTILDAANAVITNNLSRKPKELWTDEGDGHAIVRYHADTETDEAQWVAHEIAKLHDSGDHTWGDVAVFYRTNGQSRVMEEHLLRAGIPYKVVGGTRFYDRREIKDALAYLKAVVNPADEVAVKRVLNVPKRGIGDSSVNKLEAWAAMHGYTFMQALRRAGEAGIQGRAVKGIADFLSVIDASAEVVDQGPGPLLESVLNRSGYLDELQVEHSVDAEGRLENLSELVGSAREAESVDVFLEQVSLVADSDQIPDDDSQVVLMTLHSAKGLEFPAVFLIGLEDGVFPHLRSLGEPTELEEERRLAYVGITRARERLYLTHAWSRTIFGSTQYNPPSRFLDEIPQRLVQSIDGNRRTSRAGSWSDSAAMDSSTSSWGDRPERRSRISSEQRQRNRERMVDQAIAAGQQAASSASTVSGYKVGDDVVHGKWGEGVVLDLQGSGDKTEITIHFPTVGQKVLLLAWAPLKKA